MAELPQTTITVEFSPEFKEALAALDAKLDIIQELLTQKVELKIDLRGDDLFPLFSKKL